MRRGVFVRRCGPPVSRCGSIRDALLASIMTDRRYGAFLERLGMPPVSKDD